jgi:KaiC/GvpD/RAD55 family RecA-like ATPase
MPDFPVSSIVDNIILLSLVEINSSLRRCLTVVKARGSAHQFDSREYVIGQGGIELRPMDIGEVKEMSFGSYSSILSRAPTRFMGANLGMPNRPGNTRRPSQAGK